MDPDYPPRSIEEDPSDQELPEGPCLDCEGQGWLHMTSGLRGREIQRCDSCCFFSMDEEAAEVHDKACGCAWAGSEEEEPDQCIVQFDLSRSQR
jgi:hypothetical protein